MEGITWLTTSAAALHPAAPLQVLGQVYVSDRNLDDDLVRSISLPAQDPNAAEVFYRVITGAIGKVGVPCGL